MAETDGCTIGHPSSHKSPKADRLFVPLAAQPFAWFRSGQKKWELRRFGRQYTPKHVRIGRLVELRRGYTGPDVIWGEILDVVEAKSLDDFFDKVPFKEVIPVATSRGDAIKIATNILKTSRESPLLGFAVRHPVTTQIPLAPDLVPLILSGRKTSTVRLGVRNYPLGPATMVSGKLNIPIEIIGMEYTTIGRLGEDVARSEGYDSLDDFLCALKRFYPEAEFDRDITIVRFRKS